LQIFYSASAWKNITHEACIANELYIQALYHEYYGDKQGALENFIQCGNWKKAHTIFMTSVAHSMFLSCKFFLLCPKQISNEFIYLVNILPFFHRGRNILLLLHINLQLHLFARNLMMSLFNNLFFSSSSIYLYAWWSCIFHFSSVF
jgi:hypothetical protein